MCIIQARMGSTRLPGKVLKKVKGITLLEYEVKRARLAKKIDKIVVATTINKRDDRIVKACRQIRVACFRGSENDVLDRYYQCSLAYPNYETVIRLTADCPLIDPMIVDKLVEFFEGGNFDYVTNSYFRDRTEDTFPNGMDVEVFRKQTLKATTQSTKLPEEREHVTPYMKKNRKFRRGLLKAAHDFSHFRLTVDYREDYEVVKYVIENSKLKDDYLTFISLLTKEPEIMLKNRNMKRHEIKQRLHRDNYVVKELKV